METLSIEIINPKALKLIRDLEEKKLIRITSEPITKLQAYIKIMRKNADSAPSLEEIQEEVNSVRTFREIKNKISEEMQGMTFEEIKDYLKKNRLKFQGK